MRFNRRMNGLESQFEGQPRYPCAFSKVSSCRWSSGLLFSHYNLLKPRPPEEDNGYSPGSN
jgi:hypothetical protein